MARSARTFAIRDGSLSGSVWFSKVSNLIIAVPPTMTRDFVICTNAINYSIALSLLGSGILTNPWILVDTRRCDIVPVKGALQWRLSITRWRLLKILLMIPGAVDVGRVYIPHHSLNKRAGALIARASNIDYIDDGLDTRRVIPRNFITNSLRKGSRYFTFEEYREFPDWLKEFDVRRVGSLRTIRDDGRDRDISLSGSDHIFIESPGCEIDEIVRELRLSPSSVLVVRHPSPIKRSRLEGDYRCVEGRDFALERVLAQVRRKSIYFGETMSFFISISLDSHLSNKIYLSATQQQLENIFGLPMFETKHVFRSGILCLVSASHHGD